MPQRNELLLCVVLMCVASGVLMPMDLEPPADDSQVRRATYYTDVAVGTAILILDG